MGLRDTAVQPATAMAGTAGAVATGMSHMVQGLGEGLHDVTQMEHLGQTAEIWSRAAAPGVSELLDKEMS